MGVAVRFAPSPTGHLHVGNIRSAILNWLYARKAGGSFLLRMDDTDDTRSSRAFETAQIEDLAWLGLTHDRFARQSERLDRYRAAMETLREAGRVYPCYETAEELELKRKLLLGRGKPPVYDRAALRLTEADRARLEAEGRTPHWRFKLAPGQGAWDDMIRGPVRIEMDSLSDPVVVRGDGRFLYLLASVVDDIDFGITHVIRGEDHVTNSAVQIQMFEALGAASPALGHFALLTGASGEGLSKRHGAASIRDLRAEGVEAMAIVSMIAKLGTSDAIEARTDLAQVIADFDIGHLGRAPARFDPEALASLNAKVLHHLSHDQVASRLAALGVGGGDTFWEAVRGNLERLSDATIWWRVVDGVITPMVEDGAFLERAAGLLPRGAWDETTWGQWTAAVTQATGAKGRALFLPLRRALTGLDHGPEMKKLLPLIGPEKVSSRLRGIAS